MASNNYAFRRLTDPFIVPVDVTATRFELPAGFFDKGGPGNGCVSFYVVNPNPFWTRLRGSTSTFSPVTATTGWLFPPGFAGVFSSQFPQFFSCLSVAFMGQPVGAGILELSYGGGA